MIPLKNKFFLLIVLWCSSHLLSAQDYRWAATFYKVSEDGFYKISLGPELLSKLETYESSDIRVFDKQNKQVPYLIRQEPGQTDKKWFHEYAIDSKEIKPKQSTSIVVHNPTKNRISNFSMIVKNNDAYKFAKLSGSDDKKSWYFITEDYPLNQMYDASNVACEKSIHFPMSNYEYYKLEINDSASAPLNILSIGNYNTLIEPAGKFTLIKPLEVQQRDSLKLKKSYVTLAFDANYHINAIHFEVTGPKFYKRQATLFSIDTIGKRVEWNALNSFYLSSNSENEFSFPELYGHRFVVVIDNADNQPVEIKTAKAFQTGKYLVAHLNKDNEYTLLLGNKKAVLPEYDLSYFADSIPAVLPDLRLKAIGRADQQNTDENELTEDWFKSKAWIWAALLVAIGLLAFVSYRMIKEMDKNQRSENE